jgi:hypothetical protein
MFATQTFSVEHIIPKVTEGGTDIENLALSCQGCNNHKYSKTHAVDPVTHQTVPLYHPRTQVWLEHFAFSEDYAQILGITPIGRATVESLNLNRFGLINLRKALYATGMHPPKFMRDHH